MVQATTKQEAAQGKAIPIPGITPPGPQAAQQILVVDDNPDILCVMQAALEQAGYEVQTAAEGGQALELLSKRNAGLLITDIFMPGQDGIETLRECKSRFPQTRIIAMSAGGGSGGKLDYLPAAALIGADATLRKPFEVDQLLETVRKVLHP
jgi:CheY-like chemotaxis protein